MIPRPKPSSISKAAHWLYSTCVDYLDLAGLGLNPVSDCVSLRTQELVTHFQARVLSRTDCRTWQQRLTIKHSFTRSCTIAIALESAQLHRACGSVWQRVAHPATVSRSD
ncbi:hypothetical protein RRG08_027811 [Elysia crispata]|uniref:Uncharacterized protein n=1 Tax=Elysia crispata TaxID=231223 RepID=A0AAE0YVQ8_9GAST|nr:hypothetical protein RRG08_027811 [Elysia crispata]